MLRTAGILEVYLIFFSNSCMFCRQLRDIFVCPLSPSNIRVSRASSQVQDSSQRSAYIFMYNCDAQNNGSITIITLL